MKKIHSYLAAFIVGIITLFPLLSYAQAPILQVEVTSEPIEVTSTTTESAEPTEQQENQIQDDVSENFHEKVEIHMFERNTCKHCKDAKEYLGKLAQERNDFELVLHNLKDETEYNNWKEFTTKNEIPKITPIILMSNSVIQGFDTGETTGQQIIRLIEEGKKTEKLYTYEEYLTLSKDELQLRGEAAGCTEDSTECAATEVNYIFTVPFLGVIDLYDYSLPSISFILGLIDGFNPCAMWVLVTFLLVLVQVGNRRRMLEIAGLFILAETVMYYLILTVWFTAWDFIGLDAIITPIVGLVAIGGGLFFLWEWKNSDGTCQVTNMEQRAKLSGRIKRLAESKLTWASALGVIALAFSVNVIEFACSVGIPQAYTKIIEINQLTPLETHANMLIYILAYMIDDFIVFGIAFYGIEKLHLTTKYSKASNLIGGVLMIALGLILIFARELLVF